MHLPHRLAATRALWMLNSVTFFAPTGHNWVLAWAWRPITFRSSLLIYSYHRLLLKTSALCILWWCSCSFCTMPTLSPPRHWLALLRIPQYVRSKWPSFRHALHVSHPSCNLFFLSFFDNPHGPFPLALLPRFRKYPAPRRILLTGFCLMLMCGTNDTGFSAKDYLRSVTPLITPPAAFLCLKVHSGSPISSRSNWNCSAHFLPRL